MLLLLLQVLRTATLLRELLAQHDFGAVAQEQEIESIGYIALPCV